MATGTFKWYTKAARGLASLDIDYLNDTIKAILLPATHTPSDDTHDYLSDILADEITTVGGTAYNARNGDATGGITLASKTIDDTSTTRVTVFGAANIVLTASGGDLGPVGYYAIFKETTTLDGSDCPLLGYATIDTAQTATDGNTFTITLTSGLMKTTAEG